MATGEQTCNFMRLLDLFKSKEDRAKLSHLKRLIALSAADGKVKGIEQSVMSYICNRESISADKIEDIIKNPKSINVIPPNNKETKIRYLRDMVDLMICDGEINEAEYLVCLHAANEFGCEPEIIDNLINIDADDINATIEPFIFKSDEQQRYEEHFKEGDIETCKRLLVVEKNNNGCKGYKLASGIGYIVKLMNEDLQTKQMTDKPMVVIDKTDEKVCLRGFPIEAQSPFGWQLVDNRDYGLTVYYTQGKVSKCVIHLFERNVDLEYATKGNAGNLYKSNDLISNIMEW